MFYVRDEGYAKNDFFSSKVKVDNMQKIIKMIQFNENIYAIDKIGNLGIHRGVSSVFGGANTGFKVVEQLCVDIIFTDALYFKQYSVDDSGQLLS